MDITFLVLVLVVVTALAFDFTNGFHDTANAMATSIATGALKPKVAVALSAVLNLVGAFLSFAVAAAIAAQAKREPIPATELVLGMKCGGSDGFSGITANPLVGRIADRLTGWGGTAVLTEVPEMFGAETPLFSRCDSEETFGQAVGMALGLRYQGRTDQLVYNLLSDGELDEGSTWEAAMSAAHASGFPPSQSAAAENPSRTPAKMLNSAR